MATWEGQPQLAVECCIEEAGGGEGVVGSVGKYVYRLYTYTVPRARSGGG
jgi:hypothetical protein